MPTNANEPRWTWIDATPQLEQLTSQLMEQPIYGIDTEFHGERTYYPTLALIQISWSGGIALIDPMAVDARVLAPFFGEESIAVLHAATHDLAVLERASGVAPKRIFDTQLAAGLLGMSTPSLASLCDQILGVKLSKGDRLTDWRRRPLTDNQLVYAAADVTHLIDLHRQITQRLQSLGRLEWALAECDAFRNKAKSAQDPETAWWRIKECRSMKGSARGVAQAVAAWRENWAMKNDRPPRFILADLAVAVIASHAPHTVEQLGQLRGVDSGTVKGEIAEEILGVVADGERMPPESIRIPPTGDSDRESRPGLALAAAWVNQIARTQKVDPTLLGTRADILAVLRGERDARLSQSWRAELIGNKLQALIGGEAAVALDSTGDLVLETRSGVPLP